MLRLHSRERRTSNLHCVGDDEVTNLTSSCIFTRLLSEDGSHEDVLNETSFMLILCAVVAMETISATSCMRTKLQCVANNNTKRVNEVDGSSNIVSIGVDSGIKCREVSDIVSIGVLVSDSEFVHICCESVGADFIETSANGLTANVSPLALIS